jgi:hypothetical protein
MTFQELRFFYYLCEDSHISNLAQQLGITQSAISLSIKSLESQIGEPLFDRIGKKLILNETGRLFKEKTYSHFLALNDAENFFKKDKISGILNIASSKTIGDFITPHIVFDFLIQHEHVNIHKDIQNSARLIHKQGQIKDFSKFGLEKKDQLAIVKLLLKKKEELDDLSIEDYFSESFLNSNFWFFWRSMFAFENWHSLLELKL